MKRTFTFQVAALLLLVAGFTSCKKEQSANVAETTQAEGLITSRFIAGSEDRIDAITRDLAKSSYSLSFDRPIPAAGITRTAYGADSYLVYADPQDLICPDPIRRVQRRYPIFRFPQFVKPTCPDMIINPEILKTIQELLTKADPRQFRGLEGIQLSNGGALLATKQFTSQFASLSLDRVDELTKGLDGAQFLIMNDPAAPDKMFTRAAYGYANLDDLILKPYQINLKDLIKPKSVGCFDPAILKVIEQKFRAVNPALYKNLGVKAIDAQGKIGQLAYQY